MSTMIWILKSIFHWHWDIFVSLIDWLLKVNQNYLSNGFFHATFKCKHINTVQQHFQKYGQLQLAAPLPPSLNSLMHYVGEDAVKSSMNLYFRHCVGLVCEADGPTRQLSSLEWWFDYSLMTVRNPPITLWFNLYLTESSSTVNMIAMLSVNNFNHRGPNINHH